MITEINTPQKLLYLVLVQAIADCLPCKTQRKQEVAYREDARNMFKNKEDRLQTLCDCLDLNVDWVCKCVDYIVQRAASNDKGIKYLSKSLIADDSASARRCRKYKDKKNFKHNNSR